MAELTDEQRAAVRQWVEEGASLPDVQRRLKETFGLTLTYMDVRLLTLDLGQPVSAMLLPTYEPDGSVPTELVFSPAPLFFSRTGYRLVVG